MEKTKHNKYRILGYIIFLFISSSLCPQTVFGFSEKQEYIKMGSTIMVPEDQKTIQQGINAAQDGDTVIVADGTYTGEGNRDIDFKGKAIVVRSENGYENCIIDCQGSEGDYHNGFIFVNSEDRNSVLEGFTIKNGWLVETVCMAEDGNGGGIEIYSSPTIRNNKIEHNRASFGGGIFSEGGSPLIENNIIASNEATRWGGGLTLEGSEIVVGNIIHSNVAQDGGGGIFSRNSYPNIIIVNNIIQSNFSYANGGGISLSASNSQTIIGNFIIENGASEYGGGICISETVGDNVFKIYNNTIVDNFAMEGGGIYNYNISDTITSCIFQLNRPQDIFNCNITYSCLKDEVPGIGNIYLDLEFITVNGISWITDISSPCVNAGNPDTTGLIFSWKDILGNERIIDNRVDIGANEVIKNVALSIPDENANTSNLFYVYPNPSYNNITIKYIIPYEGEVSITINDISGKEKSTLVYSKQNKGVYEENFDISSFSPGIYFMKYKLNNVEKINKIIIE